MPIRISKNRVALENIPLNESKGADIASASTVNLDSATGNLVHITGTTTITAITLSSGSERTVVFDAALTLTHNSTTLILPGGANITTAAGDRAIFRGDGSGNVRCISYTKASGQAVMPFNKNGIINGNFDIWQRGTSYSNWTSIGYPTVDRWWMNMSAIATSTISRQTFTAGQTEVPGNPNYYLRVDIASTGNFGQISQRVENVATLSGLTVALSFYMRRNSGTTTVDVKYNQNFGSGGSATVSGDISTGVTIGATWTKYTYTFTLPSISGKTVGTSSYLEIMIQIAASAISQHDIAQVQLEEGSSATAFEYRPIGQEIVLCQRYLELFGYGSGTVNSASSGELVVPFRQRKRVSPTIAINSGTSACWQPGRAVSNITSISGSSASADGAFLNITSSDTGMTNLYDAPFFIGKLDALSADAEL